MRDYYVTMLRGRRVAYLAGPFPSHAEALAVVGAARTEACSIDLWADFDAFGTASMTRSPSNPVGKLNSKLGIDSP